MCRKKPARNGRPIASYSALCRPQAGFSVFHPLTVPRSSTPVKYTKGKFRMTREGIDFEAMLTPWLRLCIGVAVLFVAATPLVYAIAALVRASHQEMMKELPPLRFLAIWLWLVLLAAGPVSTWIAACSARGSVFAWVLPCSL